MEMPIIRVEDASATPAITMRYICGNNDLNLETIYTDIHILLEHPGRAKIDSVSNAHKVIHCSDAFLDTFWSAAASLLDYFADFLATDTALMQSVWFHLLDEWQKSSPSRLYREIVARTSTSVFFDIITAQAFLKDYDATLSLFHRTIFTKAHARPNDPDESIIHCPTGETHTPSSEYTTGPYLSGLKPWQQFLYAGSPGFSPCLQASNGTDPSEPDASTIIRYVPQPAIALIEAHTRRARNLAATVAAREEWDAAEVLAAFQAHALAIPRTTEEVHTYPSLIWPGKTLSYQVESGAPPVKRYEGLGDPSMVVEEPDFVLLDEAVGFCKGRDAYEAVTGQEGERFDIWRVVESEDMVGLANDGGCGGEKMFEEFGDMFDEWYVEDEVC
ncbi:hypothetical protein N0V94_000589 [Neodidymelliopsis sp. IMI 364377]|nr:hypothetical protein N0V94_000589 [Neodidymelliopsis sp. IMI 364377]